MGEYPRYEVGDRVRLEPGNWSVLDNCTGTVVEKYQGRNDAVVVQFDERYADKFAIWSRDVEVTQPNLPDLPRTHAFHNTYLLPYVDIDPSDPAQVEAFLNG